jgi:hypothetical protein
VWQGGTIRIFTSWFERYKHVINPAMDGPQRDELGRFLAAGKNFHLDLVGRDAIVYFALWNGDNFLEPMRESQSFEHDAPYVVGLGDDWIVQFGRNDPDPFAASTTVHYTLPADARTTVTVYNDKGKQIAQPVNAALTAGPQHIELKTAAWQPGVYYVVLRSGTVTDALRITRKK